MAHSSKLIHPLKAQLALAGVRLRARTGCVSDLSNTMQIKQPNISQHLNILRNAGIIKKQRTGKSICYRVVIPKVYDILNSIDASLKK